MDITYFGHSAFRLKGKYATVVTDPYDASAGKFPRDIEADIVTVSHGHGDHNQHSSVKGSPFVIEGPGEYEVKGVSVIGVATFHDDNKGLDRGGNTIYVIEVEGLRLAHLGDLGHRLSEAQLEEMGSIDIVMLPVGGIYSLDPKTAAEVVRQMDPWVVIPMHYQQSGLDAEVFGQLAPVEAFLKELGKEAGEAVAKYTISMEKLPTEMQVVVLERK